MNAHRRIGRRIRVRAACLGLASALCAAAATAVPPELGIDPSAAADLRPVSSARQEQGLIGLDAAHAGGERMLFRLRFGGPVDGRTLLYLDLDDDLETGRSDGHPGVDLMVAADGEAAAPMYYGSAWHKENTRVRQAWRGDALYIAVEGPLSGDPVRLRAYAVQVAGDGGTRRLPQGRAELPRSAHPLEPWPEQMGLSYAAVAPEDPIAFGRERPAIVLHAEGPRPDRSGAVGRASVPVGILDEAGLHRGEAWIRFGFPLPAGAVFSTGAFRLRDADGRLLPAQFTASVLWPDESLQWVLVDAAATLPPGDARDLTVEFGEEVRTEPADVGANIEIDETDDGWRVRTGAIEVGIGRVRFQPFRSVRLRDPGTGGYGPPLAASAPEGVRLVDGEGTVFAASAVPPERAVWEERGPVRAVLRVEGRYGDAEGNPWQRYVTRLVFRAGSARVWMEHTHINDHLETEFCDLRSLSVPLVMADDVDGAEVFRPAARPDLMAGARAGLADKRRRVVTDLRAVSRGGADRIAWRQWDERSGMIEVGGRREETGASPGVLRAATARGAVTVAGHAFWQRWPKGLTVDGRVLSVELLPEQTDPDRFEHLPAYLAYPFRNGRYRSKWGMAFTERTAFDFGGADPAELAAEAQVPVVAVVPAAWLAQTGALGLMAEPRGRQFAAWDAGTAAALEAHRVRKIAQREFGYFNYGDWYGERGRNWGNNEYDTAYGFFMQFARTGVRDWFRLALEAARHQADVDLVHAYPDPYYIGGNHAHGMGHTGPTSTRTAHYAWSMPFGTGASGANGHIWADGLTHAWRLAGDARSMEAAIAIGEHIVWALPHRLTDSRERPRTPAWAMKAALAVYRVTGDPLYLESARWLAELLMSEQGEAGGWPRVFGEEQGQRSWMIGVALAGLQAFHEETGDARVETSIRAGAAFLEQFWIDAVGAWPHTPSTAPGAGRDYLDSRHGFGTSLILAGPMAYAGWITGNERYMEIAEEALRAVVHLSAPDGFGKNLSMRIVFTPATLALLQRGYDRRGAPDAGRAVLDGITDSAEAYIAGLLPAVLYQVRGPNERVFHARLEGHEGTLRVERHRRGSFGSVLEGDRGFRVEALRAGSPVVAEAGAEPEDQRVFPVRIEGEPGERFTVRIADDSRGAWSVHAGEGMQSVLDVRPYARISGIGRGRFFLGVPAGAEEIRIEVEGVHDGSYGAALIGPEGRLEGWLRALRLSAIEAWGGDAGLPGDYRSERSGVLVVRPEAASTGRVWSLVLWGGGDLLVRVEGADPWLSLSEETWFRPEP